MSKRHSLALLPLLSILAISPSELQRIAKRGIASEVPAIQVAPAKEEVKTEIKAEEKKEEAKTEIAAEPKKEEAKADVKAEVVEAKKDEKKEEAKPAVLVVEVKQEDKKDVKKEEKKEDKKEDNCEHEGEAKLLSEQVKLLIAQQSTITSNFNQLQQVLQQMNMKQIELEFKMMNFQQPQPFPQMNTYGNWSQFQPSLIPSSQPEIPYGMGTYGGGSPYSQPIATYHGSYNMGQSYQPFQGQNPYAPVMQNQSPIDYFGNYQPQSPSMQHDPRFSLSPVRPGSFGIDHFGFDMSSPLPQIAQPQRTSIGFVPSQLQPFQSAPQPQQQPAQAPIGPSYAIQM